MVLRVGLLWRSEIVVVVEEACEREGVVYFFFSSRRRHTRLQGDWSSDVCSSDLQRLELVQLVVVPARIRGAGEEPWRPVVCQDDPVTLHGGQDDPHARRKAADVEEIGRASCRERV